MRINSALDMIEMKNVQFNVNRGELVWLMSQLVSAYYDHNNDLALKLDLQCKPVAMFQILFTLMVNIDESDRTEYLTLVHDYLARLHLLKLFLNLKKCKMFSLFSHI